VKSIYLHGKLGQEFGKKWELDVKSIPEAFHAINCNNGNFLDTVIHSLYEGSKYTILKKDINKIKSKKDFEENVLSQDELDQGLISEELHIISSIEGGAVVLPIVGEIVIGELILNAVIMTAISYGIAALTKPPDPPKITSNQISTKSYVLNGPSNRASQGSPVPIGYGRLRIGSNVISSRKTFKKLDDSKDQNSLESFSTIQYLDLLCEGPILGFVDEAGNQIVDPEEYDKAIYLNGVPVRNNQGLYNYILSEDSKQEHSDLIKISTGEEDSFGTKNMFAGASYSKQYDALLFGPKPYASDGKTYQVEKFENLELGVGSVNRSSDFNEVEFAKENGAKIFSHMVTNINVNEIDINFNVQMVRKDKKGDTYFNWCDFIILVQSAGKEYNVLDPESGCVCLFNNLEIEGFANQIIVDGSENNQPKYQFGKKIWDGLTGSEQAVMPFKPSIGGEISEDIKIRSYELFVDNNPEILNKYQRYIIDRKYFRIEGIATSSYEFSINIKFEWNDLTEKLNSGMTFKVIKLSNEYDPSVSARKEEFDMTMGENGNENYGQILQGPRDSQTSQWNAIDGILNKRVVYITSVAEHIEENFFYPNTALASISFDSRNFASVPERTYHLKMKKMLIPSNYDPSSRKYKGAWNGLFKGQNDGDSILSISDSNKYWSDNPAWIFYDILSNPRFGVAKYGLEEYNIDKWQLYKVAKYCDELVETGYTPETKTSVPRAFSTDNVVNFDENINGDYGFIEIEIEDYFWYFNEYGEAEFSEKRFLNSTYVPSGLGSRSNLITSENINLVYQDIFNEDATISEVVRYANIGITVENLISFIFGYSNEELRIRALEILSESGESPAEIEVKNKIEDIEKKLQSISFSRFDFEKEFGEGSSMKGKKIALFLNKHHFNETNQDIKKNIQKKSCLKEGYFNIEERVIISANPDKRTVRISGPSLDVDSSFVSVDDKKYSYGGCATQINYPIIEPRFTANLYLNDKSEALNTLNAISSVFRGIISYQAGQVSVTMDSPKQSVKLFTNSNVSKEGFVYAGDYKNKKFSSSIVRFNNKEKAFKPDIVFEEDPSLMQKFGFSQKETIGFGITSSSQAQRLAKWILTTSNLEGENIKFNTSLDANYLLPGSIFEVSDEMRSGKYKSGRILEVGSYREIKKKKTIRIFDPYVVIDKPALTLGGLSRVELTISCGQGQEDFNNITRRASAGTYESSQDQDVEVENMQSSQIIKFEGTVDLIPQEENNGVVFEETIISDLILKKLIKVSIKDNLILLYNHRFKEGDRVRFTSDGTLPSGISSRNIHEESYFVINPTKHSFQISKTKNGGVVNIYSEGMDYLQNSGGLHYVCPENLYSDNHFTLEALNQVSEGSTYSLKSYVNSGIEDNIQEDFLSSEELGILGIDKDFVGFSTWTISRYFGSMYIHSRKWAHVKNLGWIYIGAAISDTNSDNIWFYIEYVGWSYVPLNDDDNIIFLSAYKDHANINPWLFIYKNEEDSISHFFVTNNDMQNFSAYIRSVDVQESYLGENDSIFLNDINGNPIRSNTEELKQFWNSSELTLKVYEYNSLPEQTSITLDGFDNIIIHIGKDSFDFNYFYLGYNSSSSEQGKKARITRLFSTGFTISFLNEDGNVEDLVPETVPGDLSQETLDTDPGLNRSSIKEFFAVDKYDSISGLDCIQLELNSGHNLSLNKNLFINITGVSQNDSNLQFQNSINSEWSTIYVDENRIELVDSISLKEILYNEEGTISLYGNIENSSGLSIRNEIHLDRKLYRVIKIKELSESKFEVIGSEYNPAKFDAIDRDISTIKPYIPIPPQADMDIPSAPEELELFDYTVRDVTIN